MTHRTLLRFGLVAGIIGIVLVFPALGQFREYYLYGKILDTAKNPIEGVEISLRDVGTSRGYHMKTDKKGEYRFAGLPHGVYKATFSKGGFAVKQDEWKFETPQDTMQKVEIPAVTLATQAQIQEVQTLKETEAGIKESSEKIRQGDFDGAIVLLKALLAKNPKDPNANYLIGLTYVRKSMIDEALNALLLVTSEAPRFAAAYHYLGICYQQKNDPEKALEAYRKAHELDPASADDMYNMGLILFKMNRVDEALADFEAALAVRPDDPSFLEMAGRCYINQVKFEKAIAYLEKAKAAYSDPEKIQFLDDLLAKLREQIKK